MGSIRKGRNMFNGWMWSVQELSADIKPSSLFPYELAEFMQPLAAAVEAVAGDEFDTGVRFILLRVSAYF